MGSGSVMPQRFSDPTAVLLTDPRRAPHPAPSACRSVSAGARKATRHGRISGMPPKQSPDKEPLGPEFDDPDLDAVFARASPADTIAAVLTEARLVLAEVD